MNFCSFTFTAEVVILAFIYFAYTSEIEISEDITSVATSKVLILGISKVVLLKSLYALYFYLRICSHNIHPCSIFSWLFEIIKVKISITS